MIEDPEEISNLAEELLQSHLLAVLEGSACLPPSVGCMTAGLLHRCHEKIWNMSREQMCPHASKQRCLARIVASLTGGKLPSWQDAERPGQRMDRYLDSYVRDLKRARKAEQRATQRARAAGREEPARCKQSQVQQQVFHCTYGCTPATQTLSRLITPPGCLPREVEYQTCSFSELNLQLRAENNLLKQEHEASMHQLMDEAEARQKLLSTALTLEAKEVTQATKRVSKLQQNLKEEQARAAEELMNLHGTLEAVSKEKENLRRNAEREKVDVRAELFRLQGHVARAHQEAACEAERAAKLKELRATEKQKTEKELKLLKEEVEAMKLEKAAVKKESERKQANAQAELFRLQGHVTRAHQEAACEAERAAKLKELREADKQKAEKELQVLKEEIRAMSLEKAAMKKEAEKKEADARAKLFKLQGHVARAHQDAACEAERAAKLTEMRREEQEKLKVAREELAQVEHERDSEVVRRRVADTLRRKAEYLKGKVLDTSEKRLCRKKEALERVQSLLAERDELLHSLEKERLQAQEQSDSARKMSQMPTWRRVREGGRGGGLKLEHTHRLCILQQFANGTPASAIGRNIVSIVKATAPWLDPVEPTVGEIRKIGFELTTAEEALSARKVASAFRVRLIGFDETTDRQEPSITSNVQVESTEGATLEDVILKAAYLSTQGGTSEAIVQEIEGKCFARLRELLRKWEAQHRLMFPDVQWSGPDASRCSLYRLAGGGAVMSDTCNSARKAKTLLAQLIQRQAEEHLRQHMGEEVWDELSAEEQQHKLRVHVLDCQQHIRNIFLQHMSRRQAEYVQAELAGDLSKFSSWERMTTAFDQLLRAVYKEFHHGGKYYKGKGAEFSSWMREHYPSVCFIHVERAEGGRQDLDFDAAVPIYFNRPYLVEYLHTLVHSSQHSNILEDFLYTVLRSAQFIAMARANAVIDLCISRPLRWLAGKSPILDSWSPYKMNWVLDIVDDVFNRAQNDGRVLLDPAWKVFKAVADEQPLFREYLNYTFNEEICLSPDGKTRHLKYKLALEEVLSPSDATNQRVEAKTIEYLQIQSAAALEKLHDTKLAIADKLSSEGGRNSVSVTTAHHADTMACHATNDGMAESVYGAYKYERLRNPCISQRRASGLAQTRVMRSFQADDAVQHRATRKSQVSANGNGKKKQKKSFGYYYTLPYSEQVALLEMARVQRSAERALDHKDQEELDAFRVGRRKSNSELELESLVKQFALALSFYDRYKHRGVRSTSEMEVELNNQPSTQLQLDWLREQIEMRVVGLCWVEFKTNWSSSKDEEIGTVDGLKGRLLDILEEEKEREIPTAAPAPIMQRKTFKELGIATVQAELLATQRLNRSEEELRLAAEHERERLESIGELDTVGDKQPSKPPPLDDLLVGRQLEVRWRYWRPAAPGERGKKKQGTVVEVSDGTIRQSKRSKTSLPSGAVRFCWPADAEFNEQESYSWCILNPDDWNREVHLGWRWVSAELRRLNQGND